MVAVNTPSKNLKKLFPKGIIRKKTNQSNDVMYKQYSAKEIRNFYIKQSKSSWKTIDMMINCEIKEGNNYIIEGHQLHPKLIDILTKKYGGKNVRSLILTRFNVNKIVGGCLKHRAKNDWFIQKTKEKETFYKIAEMLKIYSNFFDKEAEKYKIKIINTDTNFLNQLNKAVKYLQ